MKRWMISIAAITASVALAADDAGAGAGAVKPRPSVPKVLIGSEPVESRVLRLPGPIVPRQTPPPPVRPAKVLVAPGWQPVGTPALPSGPEVTMSASAMDLDIVRPFPSVLPEEPRPVFQPIGPPPLPSDISDPLDAGDAVSTDTPRATLAPPNVPKPAYPAGFAQESAVYCQKQIGRWTLEQARALFGEPKRQRPAIDDGNSENGRIYAFRDPTSRYRELELDFDKDKGVLRTVFVYPWNLSWQDCRRLWGTEVNASEGSRGRVFYSYVNRRLDVLVDSSGKVISLGLY